jgi:hypothetical protein
LPFDNVSHINDNTSDALCAAITGAGLQQRMLYTNADAYIFKFKRCFTINGIHNVATRPDLLDRSILVELERITEKDRRAAIDILSEFEADRASILGGIFDTLSKAMAIYPTLVLDSLPRMADFARWGYAVGEALGGHGEAFLAEYTANRDSQNIEAINEDSVATLMVVFMKDRETWQGLVSELLVELINIAPKHGIDIRATSFPKQPNSLSKRIKAVKSNLEAVGISFERDLKNMRGTVIYIKNANVPPLAPLPPYVIRPKNYNTSQPHDNSDSPPCANPLLVNDNGGHGGYGGKTAKSDDEGVNFNT